MRSLHRIYAVMAFVLLLTACGDDSGPEESYACADGTTLEVIRPDVADTDGNVARIRLTGGSEESADEGARVTEGELTAAISACTGG